MLPARIDFRAPGDFHDEHDTSVIVDGIDDAKGPAGKAEDCRSCLKVFSGSGAGIGCEQPDLLGEACLVGLRKSGQLLEGGG